MHTSETYENRRGVLLLAIPKFNVSKERFARNFRKIAANCSVGEATKCNTLVNATDAQHLA